MASTAAEIATNNHSGSSRTPRVRVVKGGRYGLSKARQLARTAGTVLVIAIFFGLFASIVASQARITQLSGEIDDAKSELTNAQSYNDYLSTTMDQITNSTSVQQEAEDRLGLVKMDPSQVTYVRLEDESVIERAAGTADKFFSPVSKPQRSVCLAVLTRNRSGQGNTAYFGCPSRQVGIMRCCPYIAPKRASQQEHAFFRHHGRARIRANSLFCKE